MYSLLNPVKQKYQKKN